MAPKTFPIGMGVISKTIRLIHPSTAERSSGSSSHPHCHGLWALGRQPVKLFHQTLNPYSGPWPIKRGFEYTVVGKVTLAHTRTSTIDGHSGSGGGAMPGTIVRYDNANLSAWLDRAS